jgi:hypothetical protein
MRMKFINLLICAVVLFTLGACNKYKYRTDVEFLRNYINLSYEPIQVQYDVREDWGMDCPNLTEINGILTFSEEDFKHIVDSLKKGKSYDLPLSKDHHYKRWYPSHVKKLFSGDKLVTFYDGNFFEKNDVQIDCFVTDHNEVVIDILHCGEKE